MTLTCFPRQPIKDHLQNEKQLDFKYNLALFELSKGRHAQWT